MRLLDMATGNDYPLGDYQLVSTPPCWRLFSPIQKTTMLISAAHFSLETDPALAPAPAPPAESMPEGYEAAEAVSTEPEPVGAHLGICTSLPPMAQIGERIYHEIDRREYRYTPNGWVPQAEFSSETHVLLGSMEPQPEPAPDEPVPEAEPEPESAPPQKPRPKRKK